MTSQYIKYPNGSGAGVLTYANFAALPATAADGAAAITLDTDTLWVFNLPMLQWRAIGEPGDALTASDTSSIHLVISASNLNANLKLSSASAVSGFTAVANQINSDGLQSQISNASIYSLFSATGPIGFSSGAISITQASGSAQGYLSSTDWNTFNNKQSALTFGTLSSGSSGIITITGGTNAVIGSGAAVTITQATGSASGYLSSGDWTTFNSKASAFTVTAPLTYASNVLGITKATTSVDGYLAHADFVTFNNKQNALTPGAISETGSSVLTISSGASSTVGPNVTIQVEQANTSQSGYLSSTDWNTFNSKMAYIAPYDQNVNIASATPAGNAVTLPSSKTYAGLDLEVLLNGLALSPGASNDYIYNGTPGAYTSVIFNYDLVALDVVRFRIARPA